MVLIFILLRVLFHFFIFILFIYFFRFCAFLGILGGVPGFLGGVPGFLGGVPGFRWCSGFLGVPGCSGVPVFLEVLHAGYNDNILRPIRNLPNTIILIRY